MTTMEVVKSSMLDAIMETFVDNKRQLLHCLVCVSRLSPSIGDKRTVGGHYEQLFRACSSQYQGEGPTGILLVYPQHCLHLVEAPSELLMDVVKDLEKQGKEKAMLVETKILIFATNIKMRFYGHWCHRVLNLPTLAKGDSYQTNNPVHETVVSNVENLYILGQRLGKMPQLEQKKTLDNLPEKLPELLLQQDVLEYFLAQSELMHPTEFIQLYGKLPQVTLDGETIWPVPVRLFPYD
ncbi:testis-expressed protein 47-like [Dysidea avara]|uniref:testis-expressed protein 47-like n=1 Tax=Dysidea avara TaxID=196820 RepID=UPI003330B46B